MTGHFTTAASELASALAERDSWKAECDRLRKEMNQMSEALERMSTDYRRRGRVFQAIVNLINGGEDGLEGQQDERIRSDGGTQAASKGGCARVAFGRGGDSTPAANDRSVCGAG